MSATSPLSDLLTLQGRRVLVTGGSGGIGEAVVELLIRAGAAVTNVDRPGHPGPAGAAFLPCDLGDPVAVRALCEALPEVDCLVHCAGITRDGVVWKMRDEDWDAVLRVNLDAAFRLVRAVVPRMREMGQGRIVLISSINGERGKFGQSNYAASKAGLIGFARSVAREVGRFGIRVNVVAPGLILTSMTEALPEPVLTRALEETALGEAGQPRDVARAVLYLCSDLSSHVTGQVLRVDGGQLTA